MNYLKIIFSLVVFTVLLGCWSKEKPGQNATTRTVENVFTVGAVAKRENLSPEFQWENASGKKYNFDSYREKVTIVNFWATWCAPCKKELPDLIAISKEYAKEGIKVVGISIDRGGNVVAEVSDFVKEHNINYDIIIDNGSLEKAFGNVRGVPATFFIDKEGKILDSFVGARPKEFFVSKINQYIQ